MTIGINSGFGTISLAFLDLDENLGSWFVSIGKISHWSFFEIPKLIARWFQNIFVIYVIPLVVTKRDYMEI